MSDWQPIKTAPKNNTKVLIYVPPMKNEGAGYPEIIMVSRFKGYWWDAGHLKPTHWMPLPEPPTDRAKIIEFPGTTDAGGLK